LISDPYTTAIDNSVILRVTLCRVYAVLRLTLTKALAWQRFLGCVEVAAVVAYNDVHNQTTRR
jgi:hypothetical protein